MEDVEPSRSYWLVQSDTRAKVARCREMKDSLGGACWGRPSDCDGTWLDLFRPGLFGRDELARRREVVRSAGALLKGHLARSLVRLVGQY